MRTPCSFDIYLINVVGWEYIWNGMPYVTIHMKWYAVWGNTYEIYICSFTHQIIARTSVDVCTIVQYFILMHYCTILYTHALLYNTLYSCTIVQYFIRMHYCTILNTHALLYNTLYSCTIVQYFIRMHYCTILYTHALLYNTLYVCTIVHTLYLCTIVQYFIIMHYCTYFILMHYCTCFILMHYCTYFILIWTIFMLNMYNCANVKLLTVKLSGKI